MTNQFKNSTKKSFIQWADKIFRGVLRKQILLAIFLCISGLFFQSQKAQASKSENPIVVAYFGKQPTDVFDQKIKSLFEQFSDCKNCQIKNFTPYNSTGQYNSDQLVQALKDLPNDVQIIFFDWNEKYNENRKEFLAQLNESLRKGRILVASAGIPAEKEASCPLNRTLMGQIGPALIIGELTERDRLLPQCYYGPEMLTAVRPPKEFFGQGYGPLLFTAKLASSWNRMKPDEWVSYVRSKKNRSKQIWPDSNELLR